MATKFAPSINIERDFDKELDYILTPNAKRIYGQITDSFQTGFHAFTIIGSYGTGKSAFIWAMEQHLKGEKEFFEPVNGHFNGAKKFEFINLVGEYKSIIESFANYLEVQPEEGKVLEELQKRSKKAQKKNACLVIVVDEFGKNLEYAAEHKPERELYFIQQVAELANDYNLLFLTVLHQEFSAYSRKLEREQRKEWEKVKGRLKELTFNEPVEQLLELASKYLKEEFPRISASKPMQELRALFDEANVFPKDTHYNTKLIEAIYPLELLAAYVLTLSLQKYGQNERSLFTFLQSNDYKGIRDYDQDKHPFYNLSCVYDYLIHNYYSLLSTKFNPHYTQWTAIKRANQRIEGSFKKHIPEAQQLVKSIGLLNIFASDGAHINRALLSKYAKLSLGIRNADKLIERLEDKKIIKFKEFKNSYILYEGSDIDIELRLKEVEQKIDYPKDVVHRLNDYFDFPLLPAKAVYYKYGTPRFFAFKLTETPIQDQPKDAIDGFINLVFAEQADTKTIKNASKDCEEAILYGYFKNVDKIRGTLHEIDKIKQVLNEVREENDRVAVRELKELLGHQVEALNDEVYANVFGRYENIDWYFNGKKQDIKDYKSFNRTLSDIIEEVYPLTPEFSNELLNKHKYSSAITKARRDFITRMVEHSYEEDLGFPKDKFPAQKTIYLTLLKDKGIHRQVDGTYTLTEPTDEGLQTLWKQCDEFLTSTQNGKRPVKELIDLLLDKPFKLKQGFVDFWIPIYLLAKQEDYALFQDKKYVPFIKPDTLELILKKPKEFYLKAFNITGVKLELFNRYRKLVDQRKSQKPSKDSFIETIRPFLVFYKQLPEYTRKTERLSKDALEVREAIANAKDPEQTFFEEFPRALGYKKINLKKSGDKLENFANQLQGAIRELRTCFDELLNRVENHLKDELGYEDEVSFKAYKARIKKRYSNIKKHLLLPYQKTFYVRLTSELDDRTSWLNAIVHAALNKPLEKLHDEEEPLIYDKLSNLFHELDNLCELEEKNVNKNENVMKLELTSYDGGQQSNILRLPKKRQKEIEKLEKKLEKALSSNKKTNIATLAHLLQKQLNHE